MDTNDLKALEDVREYALRLRAEGVTEEQFRNSIDQRLPNWRDCEDFKERIEALFDILFHTFF